MAKTQNHALLPEEAYIQEALKSGRARHARISLDCIGKPGTVFQARAMENEADPDHIVRLFNQLVVGGPDFDLWPIVVFETDSPVEYLTADGVHRSHAYRMAKRNDIPSIVVAGSRRDALEYATMCNQLAVKARTPEDVRKALTMLLDDEKWWGMSISAVASHVGCPMSMVKSVRDDISEKTGKEPPLLITTAGGQIQKARHYERRARVEDLPDLVTVRKKTDTRYRSGVRYTALIRRGGATISASGDTEQEVGSRLRARIRELPDHPGRKPAASWESERDSLRRIGFSGIGNGVKWPGIKVMHRDGVCVCSCNFKEKSSLPEAAGELVAIQRALFCSSGQLVVASSIAKDKDARKIILGDHDHGPFWLIELYKQEGFEFMTLNELVSEFKSDAVPVADRKPYILEPSLC